MKRRPSFFLLFLALFLLFSAGRSMASFLIDWRWFQAIGFGEVFQTTVVAQVAAGTIGILLLLLPALISFRLAFSATRNRPVILPVEWRGSPLHETLRQPGVIERLANTAILAIGLLSLGLVASWWESLLGWANQADFGWTDPLFSRDAGFYVFTLPALEAMRRLAMFGFVLALFGSSVIYALKGALSFLTQHDGQQTRVRPNIDPKARHHLGILVAISAMLMAVGIFFDRFDLLFSSGSLIDGPGYTSVQFELPLLTVKAGAVLGAGFLLYLAITRLQGGLLSLAILLFGLSALATSLVPKAVQQLVVLPNELGKESPYIKHHLDATRHAWDLTDVEEANLTGEAKLTWSDIESNRATVQNIRLWDHVPLLDTFRQVQEIRTYYDFSNVDNDRYVIDGELRQTMLSPRELISDSLPTQAKTWVNESLVYTHGYGVALGPVNEITEDGLPLLWVKDLPPQYEYDTLAVDQPSIYFGEEMPQEVFVRTGEDEFDYPTAQGEEYTRYEGEAGLVVGNLLHRAVLAWRQGSLKVLLSGDIGPRSRVLLYRRVVDRVKRIAPFLWLDEDPYLVVTEGRLKWIVEGYTHTDRFPYAASRLLVPRNRRSASYRRFATSANYLRNSVKVIIDAYDGTVEFYREDQADPIADTWGNAYDTMFKPLSEMPADLRAHLRYPFTLFEVQADLFTTYHMTNIKVFYNREDQWEVPVVDGRRMEPYFTVMKLPGEDKEEFILMLPFTPRGKDNLAAWMVARSDGDNFGGQRVYRFPKDRLVYGPSQVVARTRQNDAISEKLTLWNQQSSNAILGTLLVIPIEEALVYVQPLYLRADDDAIPELKRVIVGYEDKITMQPTLEEGLRILFNAEEEPKPYTSITREVLPMGDQSNDELVNRAVSLYQEAQEASQNGDWARYGDALNELGQTLQALKSSPSEQPQMEVEAPAP